MTIEACVAHAIHSDLDIIEAFPTCLECPIEAIEEVIENYVEKLMTRMCRLTEQGHVFLKDRDAEGLTAFLMNHEVGVPLHILTAMCKTIVELYPMDVEYLGDRKTGEPAYQVRMTVDVGDLAAVQ